MTKKLTFYHFFEDRLNLYGDRGNIMVLANRAKWRGIEVDVHHINNAKDANLADADFFHIGGGSDREQGLIVDDLFLIKDEFTAAIEDGVVGLTICGGYQIIGEYYELANGDKIPGLGVLDYHTKAMKPGERLIGNILLQSEEFGQIVGFENHSGETFHNYDVLGTVISGYGNNRTDNKEGLVYKNLIGTYLHGPVLSKSSVLADALLSRMLERKYGDGTLEPLADTFERLGNQQQWDLFAKA